MAHQPISSPKGKDCPVCRLNRETVNDALEQRDYWRRVAERLEKGNTELQIVIRHCCISGKAPPEVHDLFREVKARCREIGNE